ncbi:hypothetical protein A3D88_04685 [Candidatus Peribacteria bacterium RIFCSPHIGHO2_02_FULL_52_16]|nr:MAG: hypothetical protein A2706_03315 [Candidatus Peribacteria bacterium RIFCSPHIGHO2_01_FULL_51_35]OGJ60898.1 MAG: hypothetical protein A3D88_04685 [Candidatus Peribacteria bacterium RIFCSPHIGHO2_02_FULL_52_16]
MFHPKQAGVLSILFVLLLVVHASQVHAVRNGQAAAGGNSIFMYKEGDDFGTAAVIKYPRCVLTSGFGAGKTMYKGDDLIHINNNTKRAAPVAGGVGPDQSTPWVDFAVLFLEKKPDGAVKYIQEADYTPLVLSKAENFGLEAGVLGSKSGYLVGYGHTGVSQGTNTGGMVRHSGLTEGALYKLGSSQTPPVKGSTLRAYPFYPTAPIGCFGDDGSPLQRAEGVTGVMGTMASANAGLCSGITFNEYSTFDDTNDTGGKTNWKRVNQMIEATCGKTLNTGKTGGGTGKVEGEMGSGQEWPPDEDPTYAFNAAMDCGDGIEDQDCTEFMHVGQVMTLEAIADTGSVFVKWVDGPPSYEFCPCAESTNATCVVDYDDMGYYDEENTIDLSGCYAEFDYQLGSE